jgi:hypothetical protein
VDAKKVGLARGIFSGRGLVVDRLAKPVTGQTVGGIVSDWIDPNTTTLLAIDAPLGWPETLGRCLSKHVAGAAVAAGANHLFRRQTDKFIKSEVGKQPLDVGADRIARTAHAALGYLDEIEMKTGIPVPLAWSTPLITRLAAIEVYPGATLKLAGYRSDGYKKKDNSAQRREIISAISSEIQFGIDTMLMVGDDDILDAAVCVLAGHHFLKGYCFSPVDSELAKKEGWIWVGKNECDAAEKG